jgi:phenylalanyl-tRNA synthetase beta chain
MKFTLSWLKEYIETSASVEEISNTLTNLGLEVESVEDKSASLQAFTVAEILEATQHPNADRLRVCKVNTGNEVLQIVCGAPNARAGIKIPLASVGVLIPNGNFEIKKSKIRDVESNGMLCSASELGLSEDSEGILELPADAVVGAPIAKFLGLDDPIFEIAITPNRGDALGVYGVARDLAAGGIGNLKSFEIPQNAKPELSGDIKISASDACSYFLAVKFKNIKNNNSPEWLKQRLTSVGQKSVNALVDITNYLNLGFSRPAHIYDADKISGNFSVRFANKSEKLKALNGKEYTLDENILVIADDKSPLAVAGVIGGEESGATDATKNAILEIANFSHIAVANSGRNLQIDSDSRYRFERKIDSANWNLYSYAIKLIQEICGAEVEYINYAGNLEAKQNEISFDISNVKKRLGFEIEKGKIIEILRDLGFGVEDKNNILNLKIPTYRPDVEIAEDVVEEIARINGYNNIPTQQLPSNKLGKSALSPAQAKVNAIKKSLANRGLREAVTFSFLSDGQAKLFTDKAVITVANPISTDLDTMRPSILPNLLAAASRNIARGFKNINLFEVGNIFEKNEKGFTQATTATGIRSGENAENSHYAGNKRAVDAFDAKADALEIIAEYVPVQNTLTNTNTPKYYHPGKSGAIVLGNKVLAYFGEIHPSILKEFDIKTTIVAFEVFIENAPQPQAKKGFARKKFEVSNFQAVERDFAFILDEKTPAENIIIAARKADKNLIDNVSIFDVYKGDKLEEGKKSIAISVRLQPKETTLTDEQIQKISNSVVENITKLGGVLRDK